MLAFVACASVVWTVSSSSAVGYVSASCERSGTPFAYPGSSSATPVANVWIGTSACTDFQSAYRAARSGDSVRVACGAYPNQQLLYQSGKRLPGIVFQPARPRCVKVSRIDLGANTGSAPRNSPPCCLTVSGFVTGRIYSWETGGPRLHDVAFIGNDITRGTAVDGQSLVLSAPVNVVVDHNRIGPTCCGQGDNSPTGIVVSSADAGPRAQNVTITNNLIQVITRDCGDWPTSGWGPCPSTTCGDCHSDCVHVQGVDNLVFAGNKLYNCRTQALFIEEVKGPTNNVTIVNNFLGVTPGTCSMCAGATYPGAVGGKWLIAFNTFNRSIGFTTTGFAPGTTIRIVGNVGLLANKDRFGDNSSCTSDTQGVFSYDYNVWGQVDGQEGPCSSTDTVLDTALVDAGTDGQIQDFHLASCSQRTADYVPPQAQELPAADVDGKQRPLRWPAAAGASQCDTARLVLGSSIGDMRIGTPETAVLADYGKPRRRARTTVDKSRLTLLTYRLHGGTIGSYADKGRIVGVTTTSPYYTAPGGVGVGTSTDLVRSSPGVRWVECRHAYVRVVRGVDVYAVPKGGRSGKTIQSLLMMRSSYGYDDCGR